MNVTQDDHKTHELLSAGRDAEVALPQPPPAAQAEAVADIRAQLDRLLPRGFVAATGAERFLAQKLGQAKAQVALASVTVVPIEIAAGNAMLVRARVNRAQGALLLVDTGGKSLFANTGSATAVVPLPGPLGDAPHARILIENRGGTWRTLIQPYMKSNNITACGSNPMKDQHEIADLGNGNQLTLNYVSYAGVTCGSGTVAGVCVCGVWSLSAVAVFRTWPPFRSACVSV